MYLIFFFCLMSMDINLFYIHIYIYFIMYFIKPLYLLLFLLQFKYSLFKLYIFIVVKHVLQLHFV